MESFKDTMTTNKRHYDVTVEIQTDYGVTYKTIKSNRDYGTGYVCQVHYDVQTDTAKFASDCRGSKSKDGWGVIGIGVLWCTIIGLAIWMESSQTGSEIGGKIFGYGLSIFFVCMGLYGLIVIPIKRRKSMADCQIIQGKQVNFTEERGDKGRILYRPIYGFYYNGMEQSIHSSISSNSNKYCQIGRSVKIVINRKTGDITCAEDEKFARKMYLLFGGFGALFLTILVLSDFTDVFSAGEDARNDGWEYTDDYKTDNDKMLEVNSDGYIARPLNMSSDECYSEYTYLPGEENTGNKAYGYTIKVYNCGVGEVTIFPVESTGKNINQFFSFNIIKSNLNLVIEDTGMYDYNKIVGEYNKGNVGDVITAHEYIYYYDGKDKMGSGGYGIESYMFTSVANHIRGCVPVKVWNAIDDEIDMYYE